MKKKIIPLVMFCLVLIVSLVSAAEYIWIEAEDYDLREYKMQEASNSYASGGKYIYAGGTQDYIYYLPGSGNRAVYYFDVQEGGTYYIWGRVIATNSNDDSFWVIVDNVDEIKWNNIPLSAVWDWDDVHDSDNNGNVVTFNLNPGNHELQILQRETGTKLDKILITNDNSLIPSGLGEQGHIVIPGEICSNGEPVMTVSSPPFDSNYVYNQVTFYKGYFGCGSSAVSNDITVSKLQSCDDSYYGDFDLSYCPGGPGKNVCAGDISSSYCDNFGYLIIPWKETSDGNTWLSYNGVPEGANISDVELLIRNKQCLVTTYVDLYIGDRADVIQIGEDELEGTDPSKWILNICGRMSDDGQCNKPLESHYCDLSDYINSYDEAKELFVRLRSYEYYGCHEQTDCLELSLKYCEPVLPYCGDGEYDSSVDGVCEYNGPVYLNAEVCNNNENECREDCTCCGDGIVQPGEECDDGNTIDDDECSNSCTIPKTCGDNVVNQVWEYCDGTDMGTTVCEEGTCIMEGEYPCTCCGDGVLQTPEICDFAIECTGTCDENNPSTWPPGFHPECNEDCEINPYCGDGIQQEGEFCDADACDIDSPGYWECVDWLNGENNVCRVNENECREDCTCCGDGVVQGDEECDDGNTIDDDDCSNSCEKTPPKCYCDLKCNKTESQGNFCWYDGSEPEFISGWTSPNYACPINSEISIDSITPTNIKLNNVTKSYGFKQCEPGTCQQGGSNCLYYSHSQLNFNYIADIYWDDIISEHEGYSVSTAMLDIDLYGVSGVAITKIELGNSDDPEPSVTLCSGQADCYQFTNNNDYVSINVAPYMDYLIENINNLWVRITSIKTSYSCHYYFCADLDIELVNCLPENYCGDGTYQESDGECEWNANPQIFREGSICFENNQDCRQDQYACTCCGDGIKQNIEFCDDGNAVNESNGDSNQCRTDCTACGDGELQEGETCDFAQQDIPECRGKSFGEYACTYCGDGEWQHYYEDGVTVLEECEYAAQQGSPGYAEGCQSDCTINLYCGDGIWNPDIDGSCEPDECVPANDWQCIQYDKTDENFVCDDNEQDCRQDCTCCGDGLCNGGEVCEINGNINCQSEPEEPLPLGLSCREDCTYCGDGICQSGEQCEPNGNFGCNGYTIPEGYTCTPECIIPYCGDGICQSGEECEPNGNINCLKEPPQPLEGMTCTPECELPRCGDGDLQYSTDKACEYVGSQYIDNPPYTGLTCQANGQECRGDDYDLIYQCTCCGDGVWQEELEQCDPGITCTDICDINEPTTWPDGYHPNCEPDCTFNIYCGDGVWTSSIDGSCEPDACDPANNWDCILFDDSVDFVCDDNAQDCREDCTCCGDNIVQGIEFCDDGNTVNEPNWDYEQCRRDCTACGDDVVQTEYDETCDPGNEKNLFMFEEMSLNQYLADVSTIITPDNFKLLSDNNYEDRKGDYKNDVDYTESITFLNNNGQFIYDDDEGGYYLLIENDDPLYQYELDFSEDVLFNPDNISNDFAGTDIVIQGELYTITDATVSSNELDKIRILTGDSVKWLVQNQSFVIGDYTITVVNVDSNETMCGVVVNEEQKWIEKGETEEFGEEDEFTVGVLDVIRVHSLNMDKNTCKLALGAKEIILEDNDEISINSEHVDGSLVQFETSTNGGVGHLSAINVQYTPNIEAYLGQLNEWVDPVFGSFKIVVKETTTENIAIIYLSDLAFGVSNCRGKSYGEYACTYCGDGEWQHYYEDGVTVLEECEYAAQPGSPGYIEGCTQECTINLYCGDGKWTPDIDGSCEPDACDPANDWTCILYDDSEDFVCDNNEQECRQDCTCCGDGIWQQEHGEECDPGITDVTNPGYHEACRPDCTIVFTEIFCVKLSISGGQCEEEERPVCVQECQLEGYYFGYCGYGMVSLNAPAPCEEIPADVQEGNYEFIGSSSGCEFTEPMDGGWKGCCCLVQQTITEVDCEKDDNPCNGLEYYNEETNECDVLPVSCPCKTEPEKECAGCNECDANDDGWVLPVDLDLIANNKGTDNPEFDMNGDDSVDDMDIYYCETFIPLKCES